MSHAHDELALAGPYVLGALEPAERQAFEAHVRSCAVCREEVRSLIRVTDALARAVPQHTPRPELRGRVVAAITGGVPNALVEAPTRQPRGGLRAVLLLAAAIVVAVGLGAYAWHLQRRLITLEARLGDAERRAGLGERATVDARRAADETQTALAVLAAPDLTRIDLTGQPPASQARGRALWSRTRGMVFTATDLPPAPAGRVYQVWVVTAQAPVSAGLISPDISGRATVFFATPADIATPVAVAVTLEPAGGMPAPTGDKYLLGTAL